MGAKGFEQTRKVVCAGDIALNGLDLTADQCDCLSQLCFPPAGDKHACTFLCKTTSDSKADTAITPGDKVDFSTQFHHCDSG